MHISARTAMAMAAILSVSLIAVATSTAPVQAQAPADADDAKIWTGVYTTEQAQRGKNIYEAYCTRCHGLNLLGGRQGGVGGPALKDANFWVSWERAPLSTLYSKVQRTMPLDSPASLREDDYTDVVAFMLAENTFPAGKTALPPTGLENIRIARRAGEATEVPNFALVQVVGCLTAGANKSWTLTQATTPVLTRSESPDAASLAQAAASPAGSTQVRLIGASQFKPETSAGQRVEVRGLLDKSTSDVRVDMLSLKSVGTGCSR